MVAQIQFHSSVRSADLHEEGVVGQGQTSCLVEQFADQAFRQRQKKLHMVLETAKQNAKVSNQSTPGINVYGMMWYSMVFWYGVLWCGTVCTQP